MLVLNIRNKKSIFTAVYIIAALFILFTMLHCLYYESPDGECALGFLGIHKIINSSNNSLNIIFLVFFSVSILRLYKNISADWRLIIKYFIAIKLYIRRTLCYCRNIKLFDQLRLAYAQGIINSIIYPIE